MIEQALDLQGGGGAKLGVTAGGGVDLGTPVERQMIGARMSRSMPRWVSALFYRRIGTRRSRFIPLWARSTSQRPASIPPIVGSPRPPRPGPGQGVALGAEGIARRVEDRWSQSRRSRAISTLDEFDDRRGPSHRCPAGLQASPRR